MLCETCGEIMRPDPENPECDTCCRERIAAHNRKMNAQFPRPMVIPPPPGYRTA